VSIRERPFRLTSWYWGEVITATWVAGWIVAGFVLLLSDAFGKGWLGFLAWACAVLGAVILGIFVMPPTAGDSGGDGAVGF
jgi:hypothetical protein